MRAFGCSQVAVGNNSVASVDTQAARYPWSGPLSLVMSQFQHVFCLGKAAAFFANESNYSSR